MLILPQVKTRAFSLVLPCFDYINIRDLFKPCSISNTCTLGPFSDSSPSRVTHPYSSTAQFALTLKAPITTVADDIHIFFHCFSEKIRLDVSSESSARQRIHMKIKSYFLRKIKVKN